MEDMVQDTSEILTGIISANHLYCVQWSPADAADTMVDLTFGTVLVACSLQPALAS